MLCVCTYKDTCSKNEASSPILLPLNMLIRTRLLKYFIVVIFNSATSYEIEDYILIEYSRIKLRPFLYQSRIPLQMFLYLIRLCFTLYVETVFPVLKSI